MRTLTLGIVAHVDAGKTSLTERLLAEAGVLDEPGSVDAGTTRTDSMALERRRGITIRAAVTAFEVDGTAVTLIDTPGHPDFIAEVERSLAVLDGAVVVVSAVEGVQAQTVVLVRALRRLGIPFLYFVNKIDRVGARPDAVLAQLRARLTPDAVPIESVAAVGGADAAVRPADADESVVDGIAAAVAETDDAVLAAWVDGATPALPRLLDSLADGTAAGAVHPVLFGSATRGVGVTRLLELLPRLLPAREPHVEGEPAGSVFKVERGPAGERLVDVLFERGTLRVRDRVALGGGAERVTGIRVFRDGAAQPDVELTAGHVGQVRGLTAARIGDVLGAGRAGAVEFRRPTLEAVVDAVDPSRRAALRAALAQLADVDPLIAIRHDDARLRTSVMLYGEVQKEVLASLLAEEHGVDVVFSDSAPVCVERVLAAGASVDRMGEPGNPFLASLGLRVEPAPVGSGVAIDLEVERGAMPASLFTAAFDGIRAGLLAGPHGWEIPDARVVITETRYAPRQGHAHQKFNLSMSTIAGDFRALAPLVLMDALRAAGTVVCEPVARVELDVPDDTATTVIGALAAEGGMLLETLPAGADRALLVGSMPVRRLPGLQRRLPDATRGEGVMTADPDRFEPVVGVPPERERIDDDPRDRVTYLAVAARRIGRV